MYRHGDSDYSGATTQLDHFSRESFFKTQAFTSRRKWERASQNCSPPQSSCSDIAHDKTDEVPPEKDKAPKNDPHPKNE